MHECITGINYGNKALTYEQKRKSAFIVEYCLIILSFTISLLTPKRRCARHFRRFFHYFFIYNISRLLTTN